MYSIAKESSSLQNGAISSVIALGPRQGYHFKSSTNFSYQPLRRVSINRARAPPKEPAKGTLAFSNVALLPPSPPDSTKQQRKDDIKPKSTSEVMSPDSSSDVPTQGPNTSLHPDQAQQNVSSAPKDPLIPSATELNHAFHVFTWLNESHSPRLSVHAAAENLEPQSERERSLHLFGLDEAAMKSDFEEVHTFLENSTSFEDRIAYHDAPASTRREIYLKLTREEEHMSTLSDVELVRRAEYEEMVQLVNRFEMMLGFFIPLNYEGPTIGKIWGALGRLIDVSHSHSVQYRSIHVLKYDIGKIINWHVKSWG